MADERLRKLEREALQGDPEAKARLQRERLRTQDGELERSRLLDAIRQADPPHDKAPRSSYAEWLEARDAADPRAERVRLELEIRGKSPRGCGFEDRLRILKVRRRLAELDSLVGKEECQAVPIVRSICPQCGARTMFNEGHPYASGYGMEDALMCSAAGCDWESR